MGAGMVFTTFGGLGKSEGVARCLFRRINWGVSRQPFDFMATILSLRIFKKFPSGARLRA